MSIRVELADLPQEILARGAGYLLTSVVDSRPHVAHLPFEVAAADGQVEIRAKTGQTSRQNCQVRPAATILWPPAAADPNGHSLIVDGEARVDGSHVIITAISAVLHRPASSL